MAQQKVNMKTPAEMIEILPANQIPIAKNMNLQ